MSEDLTGRRALVTGGSRGIGRAIVLALADAGCDVALTYRTRAEDAAAVVQAVRERGRRAEAYAAAARSRGELRLAAADAARTLGTIDILVNNAGIGVLREVQDITDADWDDHVAVNLTAAFVLTQAVLPAMRAQRWGRIVNLSSVAAETGGIVGPHYAATKAGLIGLTHGYARRLATEGITVNAIAPALIETEMLHVNDPAAIIPVGRFGTPEEVADACVLLARNGYMTGQTVGVNGGAYMTS